MPSAASLDQPLDLRRDTADRHRAVPGLGPHAVVAGRHRLGQTGRCGRRRSAPAPSRDLPEPDGPRISTARSPTSTADGMHARTSVVIMALSLAAEPRSARLTTAGLLSASPTGPPWRFSAQTGRYGPRRSAWRSTGRGRSSGQSPDAAGRCRNARRCSQRVGADARALVIDHDLDRRSRRARRRPAPCRPGAENELRVGDAGWRRPDRAANRGPAPRTHRAAAPLEARPRPPTSWPSSALVGDRDQRRQQPAQIDRRHVLALQLGIEAAGVGNIGDQPVEPLDVVLDHREQARAAVLVLRASGSVSTAERSEVSGFFSSWATSAANISIASMRL